MNLNHIFIKEPAKYCNIISQQQYEDLKLHKGDVLICRTNGNPDFVGRAAVIMEDFDYAFASYLFRVNVSDEITPEYFVAYLQSKYGRIEIDKNSMKGNQTNFSPAKLKDIKIPCFSKDFCLEITDKFNRAYDFQQCSKTDYKSAEKMLEESLGINQSSNDIVSIKSLSESFNISGRLDAEYYQPKYEQYEEIIKNNKLGFTIIKKEFDLITKKCDRSLEQYPYIEIGDINVSTGVATSNIIMTEALPDNAKIMTKVNDVLVSTVRPNRGAVSILEEDDLLVSGAFTVLREKGNYPKEVLLVILRSELYRDWLLKYNVGTSYPVIKDDDILNLPLPILDEILNKEISDKVQESFRLRKESKKLLDITIKAVEMAIETDEETAIAWLKEQGV